VVRVPDAVRERNDPVASGEHLAGDFSRKGIGAVEEGRLDQGKRTVEEHPEAEQRKDKALGRTKGGHRVQVTGCSEQGTEEQRPAISG
jgi:hypothetical protein